MGYDLIKAEIHGRLSNHNSPRDDTDRALWNELMYEIKNIIERPRFRPLELSGTDLPTIRILDWSKERG